MFVPWEPFGRPNLALIIVSGALLGYLVRTWRKPRLGVAAAIAAFLIVYTLVRLPWQAVMWCRLGRPLEAFTVPQLAAVTIGFLYPGRWSHGMVTIWLFGAEGLFAFFYARHLGLDALVPLTEPYATLSFTLFALGFLFVRQRSRDIAEQQLRSRAEIQELEHLRPLFARAGESLEAQVDVLASEVRASGVATTSVMSGRMRRALDRLGDLRRSLGELVTSEETVPSVKDTERRLLDHEAQQSAISVTVLGVVVAVPVIMTFRAEVEGGASVPLLTAVFVVFGMMLSYLLVTRRQPSARRATAVILVLFVITLPVVDYNQYRLLEVGRPYAPFLGHKQLMCILGLTLATRFKLGVVLLAVTAANAVVIWFALDLGAHIDVVESSEPFPTLIYMLVGVSSLRMLARRRTATLELLRSEAEASALHRRAVMFFALRDRLNSPLQTLVLTAPDTVTHVPASAQRVQAALDRLIDLSRELAELDVPLRAPPASIDVDRDLRLRS